MTQETDNRKKWLQRLTGGWSVETSSESQSQGETPGTPQANYITRLGDYFRRYAVNDTPETRAAFVQSMNKEMQQMRPRQSGELHPITTEEFSAMLDAKIGPRAEWLAVLPHIFRIFGDERETFLAVGELAVVEENARRGLALPPADKAVVSKPVEDDTGLVPAAMKPDDKLARQQKREVELLHAIAQEEASKRDAGRQFTTAYILRNAQNWRRHNPDGIKKQESFQEILEKSHANGDSFKIFMFDRLLPAWNVSQEQFAEHVHTLDKRGGTASQQPIADELMTSWRLEKTKILRDKVELICRAFSIEPGEGEEIARHEKMLWKMIDGHEFTWGGKHGTDAMLAAISDCKKSGETGALAKELVDASGLRFKRLQTLLGGAQFAAWMRGEKITSMDAALHFLDLVDTHLSAEVKKPEKVSKLNKELLSLLTGRKFDIESIIESAEERPNPGGALFTALTGRHGLVTVPPQQIVAHFADSKLAYSEAQISKMRTGTQLVTGGKINEATAESILTLVEKKMQPLVDRELCEPFTDEQKINCVDILTGIPHPKKMLQAAVMGDLPIGKVVSRTCERRDIRHIGPGSFCESVGISQMSNFVLGKSPLEGTNARKMADWYGLHYGFDADEQAQFISLAKGVELKRTPDTILADVISGVVNPLQGLRDIYAYRGLTRPAIAEKAGVTSRVIRSSVETGGGYIKADAEALTLIGRICGISEGKLADFVNAFTSRRVAVNRQFYQTGEVKSVDWDTPKD